MITQLVLGLLLVSSCYSRSDVEIKGWFFTLAIECNKEYSILPEELVMLQKHEVPEFKLPDSEGAKCLMACIYKKAELMDDKGNYDVAKTSEWIKTEYGDEPARFETAKDVFETCKTVNDEAVSDGEKGCERAYLLSTCLIKRAPKMET